MSGRGLARTWTKAGSQRTRWLWRSRTSGTRADTGGLGSPPGAEWAEGSTHGCVGMADRRSSTSCGPRTSTVAGSMVNRPGRRLQRVVETHRQPPLGEAAQDDANLVASGNERGGHAGRRVQVGRLNGKRFVQPQFFDPVEGDGVVQLDAKLPRAATGREPRADGRAPGEGGQHLGGTDELQAVLTVLRRCHLDHDRDGNVVEQLLIATAGVQPDQQRQAQSDRQRYQSVEHRQTSGEPGGVSPRIVGAASEG